MGFCRIYLVVHYFTDVIGGYDNIDYYAKASGYQGALIGRFGNRIAGGILQTGIEISRSLQIKQLAHILAGGVLEGGGLDDGDLAGFTVAGSIAALDAFGVDLILTHGNAFFLKLVIK